MYGALPTPAAVLRDVAHPVVATIPPGCACPRAWSARSGGWRLCWPYTACRACYPEGADAEPGIEP